ncbi:MAG: PLP-dependent cysteine synthase family protein, partial [bacterium]
MSFDDKILETIGKTPLVQLRGDEAGDRAQIYAKLEMFNPGGSVKDRPALNMILDAEKRGVLDSRTTVIEATSGNTGIALSMICAVRGYECIIVMPENMSIERIKTMEAYGAKIELTSKNDGMKGALARVEDLCEEL